MSSRFDIIYNRRGSGCFKYDALKMLYGKDDLLSLWVADMDFAVSDQIQEALAARLNHPVFGYNLRLDDFYEAVINWQQRRFGWQVARSEIIAVPGIVPGIILSILSLTNPGDGVLIQTPVYRPFQDAVNDHGRRLICSALLNENGCYRIDWQDFELKLKEARLFILCSPHNPVSRVWSREELIRIGELCSKYKVRVFSDEIHQDIVYAGHQHIPLASLQDFQDICITGISPSKSFNVAGLATAVLLVSNPELFTRVNDLNQKMHLYLGNSFGIRALIAAYRDSEPWLCELLAYLEENRKLIMDFLGSELPDIKLSPIEGSYLAWLDFRAWDLEESQLQAALVQKARLALDPGEKFGVEGSGFQRLNFGCPRSILMEALDRLKTLAKDYK
ncbi:MAG TPA: PatB family C-S lyase [Candidatus Cloacimonas sp.]|nr:PatB family C-S lyase [Candidatus Cloacimonas sp.]